MFHLRDSHPLRLAFPHHSVTLTHTLCRPYPDPVSGIGLASSDFARHYFRNLVWFLFLSLLRCFSSGGSLPYPMNSDKDTRFFTVWVSPFGHPRVIAYFQLTAAFRRLSRPSSAISAKAFTLRSFSLEQPSFAFSPYKKLASIAWASQIIVFGLWTKRPFWFFIHRLSAS